MIGPWFVLHTKERRASREEGRQVTWIKQLETKLVNSNYLRIF